jgi:hypothetical protein
VVVLSGWRRARSRAGSEIWRLKINQSPSQAAGVNISKSMGFGVPQQESLWTVFSEKKPDVRSTTANGRVAED